LRLKQRDYALKHRFIVVNNQNGFERPLSEPGMFHPSSFVRSVEQTAFLNCATEQ
jgi:hypothetical protein